MSDIAFHLEAQRQQRMLERRHQSLEKLKLQLTMEQKTKPNYEQVVPDNEKIGTRAGPRGNTRSNTRTATHAGRTREAFWVPDICQTTSGSAYYRGLIPQRPVVLHQWRDLKNRIRHDYNLVPLPHKKEDIVKR